MNTRVLVWLTSKWYRLKQFTGFWQLYKKYCHFHLKKSSRFVINTAIILILFFTLIVTGSQESVEESVYHHFELACEKFHNVYTSDSSYSPEKKFWEITGNINQLCTLSSCHSFEPILMRISFVTG